MPSDTELLAIQFQTAFVLERSGRISATNDPDHSPAPRFALCGCGDRRLGANANTAVARTVLQHRPDEYFITAGCRPAEFATSRGRFRTVLSQMTETNTTLVTQLIRTQFPQWAELPVAPVENGGWDNRTFRLGDSLDVGERTTLELADVVEADLMPVGRIDWQILISIAIRVKVICWRQSSGARHHGQHP
jgi:hypothetical protein